jgi:Holliday junction resolvase RusA-like endonuclease
MTPHTSEKERMSDKQAPLSPLVTLTIPGRPRVLKNGKRIFGRGRRKIVLPSAKYAEWERIAMAAVKRANSIALLDCPLTVHYRFYFANRSGEADVSNLCEGPGDVMQKAGVIANDKLIMRIVAEKFFGGTPRTEVEIFKYEL